MSGWYDDEDIVCQNCGKDYTWYGSAIRRMDGDVPDVCKFCLEHPDLHPIELECQNASHPDGRFTWTPKDQWFYAEQGYKQPELCKPCREQKKAQRGVNAPVKCTACGTDYTYTWTYIISFRRKEGEFDGRDVCRLCFDDPARVERLKQKAEERKKKEQEKKKKEFEFRNTVGYYLLVGGTEAEQQEWRAIVGNDSYNVPSNVSSYDVPDQASWYINIPDHNPNAANVLEHIVYGATPEKDHGWHAVLEDIDDVAVLYQAVVDIGVVIAEHEDSDVAIECREGKYIIKYDDTTGAVAFIRETEKEYAPPDHRLNSCYPMSQEQAAANIRKHRWERA